MSCSATDNNENRALQGLYAIALLKLKLRIVAISITCRREIEISIVTKLLILFI